ncbi:MAG: hypothetical protein LBL13_00475 [Bacteroidales bacterium]|nr:hypothetical protein [Bacteroidales bacterium]
MRKRFFLFIAPVLLAVMLTFIQCGNKRCEDAICTDAFESISLDLKYPDGQPVLLDSSMVFWKSKNLFLDPNAAFGNEPRIYGSYIIVTDAMQKDLKGKKEIMHFTGYLNGEIVLERDVLVGANCCHVDYLGKESLIYTISGIPDDVRENRFCELVNTKHIRKITPSYNAFVSRIDKNVPYEDRLQMVVDWLLSHKCIIDARIDCILCLSIYQGDSDKSRIAFSFIENGKTVNMIMLVTGDDAYFAGVFVQ